MRTCSRSNVAASPVAVSMASLACCRSWGTVNGLGGGGATALSVSMLMIGKKSALPLGTVTVRVTFPASGNVPTRKKNLLAGPIPFRWPTAANCPVVSRMGNVFVRPTATASWSYTHFHHTAVKAPKSLFSGTVGGLGLA
jgi:hypothetical protein